MNTINYAKYTANGNNFVILDEIRQEKIPEEKKPHFSKMICNETTGIGCDTLIIVQRYSEENLKKIYGNNKATLTEFKDKRFIMRVFERDGSESHNCGNGLICLGHHLHRTYLMDNASIATEIPSSKPYFREVKSVKDNFFRVALGKPALPSKNFVTSSIIDSTVPHGKAYHLKNIPIAILLNNDKEKYNFADCYITFTGEPHLVIFDSSLNTHLFPSLDNDHLILMSHQIMQQIGLQFNALKNFFPQGININFAKLLENGKIAYRCFERGVNRETLACGTGAAAVASIAKELLLIKNHEITILPWRARYEPAYQDAEILITIENQQYNLLTQSILLSEGTYYT